MKPKKTEKASLENKRGTNFIIGLIVTLSLILISFEWNSTVDVESDLSRSVEIDITEEIIDIIPREKPKPPPKELPPVMEVIKIVDEVVEFPPLIFDPEGIPGEEYPHPFPIDDLEDLPDEPQYFYIVEDMPQFNEGDPNREFARYIARNLHYPELPAEMGVSGKVIVQFDIDVKGNLVNVIIFRSIDPALDAEALRVVKTSPGWTPGKQRGKAVRVRYLFPINFVLQ
ncbi:MAG: energy transducer TonB [Bacteroidetes bacterium]|nr:energy transducer TonB [Bacteroidota bacterium]